MNPDPSADKRPVSAMTIAGSDSGGGAGIQADLRTFAAHGVHGLCVLAALTAQNTQGVSAVHVPPATFLRAQIDACFADFNVAAVKLGMLANAETVAAVADALETHRPRFVVLDPVMVATSGAKLLDDDAHRLLRERLLPLATVLTPNIPEAGWLLGREIVDAASARSALTDLRALGPRVVLLKGGHLDEGALVRDRWLDDAGETEFVHARLHLESHGTGCTLASAIAAHLALGLLPREAARAASDYIARALALGYPPGLGGLHVLDHFGAAQRP
ncbi:bifunctional hydroxymethylpyrimidine kinase/phosphomethylpyrimidine kinase [Lysobacter pythonis]|uniref:hydroxymethylpyrimidine kinase n=1 Tax=Solilutibacter pythonis TaxID=2483112 RepID=A0A3M2I1F6_9GAMM|nr:bifunctional hydroxymethylpyrimidine kinase/phosphomethylpyrimidine kinase [Lysobacter pythonis]RMH93022.1 bifunctional hydroxymethylpyrimidine kinase/phosphomethylpyrimidine kinase [Lysobacter pythonis]